MRAHQRDSLDSLWNLSGLQALTLSFVLLGITFPLLGFTRFIDGDEGYYLLAARLVGETRTLYSDFLYTQMPLLPYVYALWFKLFSVSWLAARGLSIALAIAVGLLLFYSLLNARHSPPFALLGVILYSSSSLAFGWLTVAKTYALSTAFLLSAYLVLRHLPGLSTPYSWLLSGLLFGCAVNTSLFVAVVLPAFLVSLFESRDTGSSSRFASSCAWYTGGLAGALLPDFYFVLNSPSAFLFGNLGYHTIRSDMSLREALSQKVEVALSLTGINTADGVVSVQCQILLLFNALYFMLKWRRERLDTAFYIAASLCVISLAPTPTFVQYFAVPLPFLIISAVLWLHDGSRGARCRSLREMVRSGRIVSWVLVGAYVIVAPIDIYRYSVSGRDVQGVQDRADRPNWSIATVRAISRELEEFGRAGLFVVSWWPGYFVEAPAKILPGLENPFGMMIAGQLDVERRRKYRVLTHAELVRRLEQRGHPVVLGHWVPIKAAARMDLRRMGYEVQARVVGTEIHVKSERPTEGLP